MRNWLTLPRDVMFNIFVKLGTFYVLDSAQCVCTAWRKIAEDPKLYSHINMCYPRNMYVDPLMFCEFNEVVIQALGRSGDGDALEELTIEFFGTDKLFYYFAAFNMLLRNLRRVRLIGCWELNNEMIVKFVEAHPMLEEFELILMSPEIETIEGIGRSCKNLKSFRLNYRARTVQNYTDFDEESYVYEANGEATAIAKTMPNLRRLDLYGNLLGSRGLQAILDGCPHLEFLDLRQCTFISLKGDALKNCVEKVKEVKLPNNPTCLSY